MGKRLLLTVSGLCLVATLLSCAEDDTKETSGVSPKSNVGLIVLNPGHYHAALVQKTSNALTASTVAPKTPRAGRNTCIQDSTTSKRCGPKRAATSS